MTTVDEKRLLKQLSYYILSSLEEIYETRENEMGDDEYSQFLLGEIYAFTECLEFILTKIGTSKETILRVEKKFGID